MATFIQNFFDELLMLKNPFTFPWSRMVLPMLTLLGAWGGFPEAPEIFTTIAEYSFLGIQPFKYFFLWVLVMQGGASADPGLSFIAVLIFAGITILLRGFDKKEGFKNHTYEEKENIDYRK